MKILNLYWHSVEPDSINPLYLDDLNPTASLFREHIKYIADNYNPISISEYMEITSDKSLIRSYTKPPVVIGFDDGFKNVIKYALPVLNEYQVPAVFFVVGEILRNPDFVPWFVEMFHLMRKAERKSIVFDNVQIDLTSKQSCRLLRRMVINSIKGCTLEEDRQRLLTNLAGLVGVERPRASDLEECLGFVSKEDLSNIGSDSLLTIASHGMTHRHLESLTYDEQVYELEQSDLLLKEHCPSYYPVISYPDGSFNSDTIEIAKGVYRSGFATSKNTSYANLYTYPRICIGYTTVQDLVYATCFTFSKALLHPSRKTSFIRMNFLLPLKRFFHPNY
ncbi:MAG: polysaccharide deacetylase family protein [Candidatus Scalindua sp.]|nr:polysaccharide deacetylase family protein [Candidatus Scalindua sp.]